MGSSNFSLMQTEFDPGCLPAIKTWILAETWTSQTETSQHHFLSPMLLQSPLLLCLCPVSFPSPLESVKEQHAMFQALGHLLTDPDLTAKWTVGF